VCSRVSKYLGFLFIPADTLPSTRLAVILREGYADIATLQARPHEIWALFFGSSLEDRPIYTPSECFETFPFPHADGKLGGLTQAGQAYYEARAEVMERNNEGLTKTYNRFHDPDEASPEILYLRSLHDAMDRAVLHAYSWTDLHPTCEFLLDYEHEDDEEDDSGRTRQRKKPWRYRWPDELRDEVLARLLALNGQQGDHERLSGGTNRGTCSVARPRPFETG